MDLLSPISLILLALIPVIIALYIWMLRRKRRFAVRYSSLSLIRQALPEQSHWRRHLPFALFLVALASLVVAFGRPVTVTTVPAGRATVVLAMDVSRSMRQADIWPSRIEAAKDAALSFIKRQHSNNQIGVVAFAGFAQLIQPPTTDREDLEAAIHSLTLGRGTAIGNGMLEALDTIAEVNPNVAPPGEGANGEEPPARLPEGTYVPDIIVLLTDGVTTTGPEPLEVAEDAVQRGVRVYTIGYGTENGDSSWGNNFFGGGGRRFHRGIDEETLKRIAEMTGGEYYSATSAGELQKVFDRLPTYLITKEETIEISFVFAAAGALLVLAAVFFSQLWHPLP